jgi:hypothetical protein
MDNNNALNGKNWRFWIRIVFYLILLVLLIVTLYRAGGDPCERCELKIDQLGDETYTCREVLEEFVIPNYLTTGDKINHSINLSAFDSLIIK